MRLALAGIGSGRALDVACGSGRLTRLLDSLSTRHLASVVPTRCLLLSDLHPVAVATGAHVYSRDAGRKCRRRSEGQGVVTTRVQRPTASTRTCRRDLVPAIWLPTPGELENSMAPRSLASRSPANSQKPSGTCSRVIRRFSAADPAAVLYSSSRLWRCSGAASTHARMSKRSRRGKKLGDTRGARGEVVEPRLVIARNCIEPAIWDRSHPFRGSLICLTAPHDHSDRWFHASEFDIGKYVAGRLGFDATKHLT